MVFVIVLFSLQWYQELSRFHFQHKIVIYSPCQIEEAILCIMTHPLSLTYLCPTEIFCVLKLIEYGIVWRQPHGVDDHHCTSG